MTEQHRWHIGAHIAASTAHRCGWQGLRTAARAGPFVWAGPCCGVLVSGGDGRGGGGGLQGEVEDFADVAEGVDLQLVAYVLGDVLEVALVACGDDSGGYASPVVG